MYSHTTFGEVLCNGGVLGMSLMAAFYIVPAVELARLLRAGPGRPGQALPAGLLAFWAMFTLYSFLAVMIDPGEYLPMYAAICGYLQANRTVRIPRHLLTARPALATG